MKKTIFFMMIVFTLFFGCKTVDLETMASPVAENDETIPYVEVEEELYEQEMHEYLVQEELKIQDIEPTVIYIEKPVYVPYEQQKIEQVKKVQGVDATKASLEKAVIKPENYKDGTFYYTYNENWVYEIYAQPYHLTDIILEEGEYVLNDPLLSEDESVWELTANVAINPNNGLQIQHLFVKPAYSNLDSTMIVITNKRVYHFRLKSFNSTHMAMVKFNYPNTKNVWATAENENANGVSVENEYITVTNPEYLSFDYKMKYGLRKPEFLPTRVYDDGNKTYIVVDDIVLHKELPLIFNERNEIVNYTVQKNVFIIPRLINKVTLRLGKQKVIVEKKKTKEVQTDSNVDIKN